MGSHEEQIVTPDGQGAYLERNKRWQMRWTVPRLVTAEKVVEMQEMEIRGQPDKNSP